MATKQVRNNEAEQPSSDVLRFGADKPLALEAEPRSVWNSRLPAESYFMRATSWPPAGVPPLGVALTLART